MTEKLSRVSNRAEEIKIGAVGSSRRRGLGKHLRLPVATLKRLYLGLMENQK